MLFSFVCCHFGVFKCKRKNSRTIIIVVAITLFNTRLLASVFNFTFNAVTFLNDMQLCMKIDFIINRCSAKI